MSEFPPALLDRCAESLGRSYALGYIDDDDIRTVLIESGYAEMVSALKDAKAAALWAECHQFGNSGIYDRIDAALRKAEAL
jgi:hypothetical protein